MLKKVLLGFAVVLAVLLIVVATRPDTYEVARSMKVAAPPEAVFAVLSDFKRFPEWSPWQRRDPAMKTTISSPSTGVGATYQWQGNSDVGSGKMTITESVPNQRVRERLEFQEPFASVADTAFDVAADGTGTNVTWSMTGNNNFMGKAFGLFMDMDKMIGKDFEEGLANLKRVVEAPAAK